MKNLFMTLALFGTCTFCSTANASCWCWQSWYWEYCLGDAWTDTPGSTVVTYVYGVTGESGPLVNGSCTQPNQNAPKKTCTVTGSLGRVKTWEITGEISPEGWGVSLTIGEEIDADVTCDATVVIESWCQCCHTRARVKYKNTFKCGECYCTLSEYLACSDTYCGNKKDYVGVVCDEIPCTVPQPCTSVCPPS